jgi:hypothetical protein
MSSSITREPSRPMTEPTACVPDPVTHRCSTCADEGREGRVVALIDDGFARVQLDDGGRADVALDLVGDVGIGDHLLVHAGTALVKLER